MKLIIDQGNTRIKIALLSEGQIADVKSFNTNAGLDAWSILKDFETMNPGKGSISAGIFSSVGKVDHHFLSELSKKIKLIVLDPLLPLPIILKYATPETLGNDRKALAVAASKQFENKDVLIIDAGTCITFDFINSKKEYLGGSISPGIDMRFKALHNFTSNLPLVTQTNSPVLIGKSTSESIQSGVINGVKAEVMGIIEQYRSHYPALIVVFTGGDLNYFDKNTKNNIFAIPNLLLLGLKEILEYNAK